MVDPDRLRSLLGRLADRRGTLDRYAGTDPADYLEAEEAVAASKYRLITAIEDVLAVANHVIASEGYRSPAESADAFAVLREHDVLDRQLSDRLQAMARFRNLLVHVYAEVDDRRVHRFLQEDLGDFDAFIRAVLESFPELEPDDGTA